MGLEEFKIGEEPGHSDEDEWRKDAMDVEGIDEESESYQDWKEIREHFLEKNQVHISREMCAEQLEVEFHFKGVDGLDLYCYNPDTGAYEYQHDEAGVVQERMYHSPVRGYASQANVEGVSYLLKSSNHIDREEMGTPEWMLPVANGMLDLKQGVLKEHSPRYNNLFSLPVKYHPDARAEKWEQFLDDVVEPADAEKLQEFVGYTLYHWDTHLERALLLVGEGANGKGTFLNTIRALLGEENVSSQSLQDICSGEWATAQLYEKIANIDNDLPAKALEDTGDFKKLVTGDYMAAERKYEKVFEFENRAKLMFSANEVPRKEDEKDAFYRRWVIVGFPNQFKQSDPKTDLNLIDKLTTDEELSGILNWALEGFYRIVDQEHIGNERSIDEKKKAWKEYGDSVEQFASECLERESENMTSNMEIWDAYYQFCDDRGYPPMNKNVMMRQLREELGYVEDCWPTIDGKQRKGMKHIRITEYE